MPAWPARLRHAAAQQQLHASVCGDIPIPHLSHPAGSHQPQSPLRSRASVASPLALSIIFSLGSTDIATLTNSLRKRMRAQPHVLAHAILNSRGLTRLLQSAGVTLLGAHTHGLLAQNGRHP